ncbi:uncharacterized protein [Rhodnius prolixus]|uniref:uncharacterized protein n=1 Tax=Rhodnius prolixus TaxID=13249 RepID=UPI003D18A77B
MVTYSYNLLSSKVRYCATMHSFLPKLLSVNKTMGAKKKICSSNKFYFNIKDGNDDKQIVTNNNLTYRIIIIEKHGLVSWLKYTGNFVRVGEPICEIIKNGILVNTITSPTQGFIANRFVDEASQEEAIYDTRIKTKEFIPLRDDETILDEDDKIEPTGQHSKKHHLENIRKILHKKRIEHYDQFIPQDIRELEGSDYGGTTLSLGDRADKFYKKKISDSIEELIKEHFTDSIDTPSHVIDDGMRNRFLVATADIDMTSAINFALRLGEKQYIKLEIKCLIIMAVIQVFRSLPHLIKSLDDKTENIDLTIGIAAGGKLAFPSLRNVDKMTYSNLKDTLKEIERSLYSRNTEIKYTSDTECFAIANDWDYGSVRGPSCLYSSNFATLALNNVVLKPKILSQQQMISQPIMSTALTVNNEKIHGQDALIFINKLKKIVQTFQNVPNFLK